MVSRREVLASTGLATSLVAGCLGDSDGEEDYPTDDIEFVVPYGPSGGFGTYSAALCEMYPPYISDDAEIICTNREGAGGMEGMRFIMRAEPDGYTIGMFNSGTLLSNQFFEDDPGYDAREDIDWIGQIDQTEHFGIAGQHTPFESLEDMLDYDGTIRIGGTDPLGPTMITWYITALEMGIEFETVTGYDGLTDIVTAILREDVDAAIGNTTTFRPPVEDGEVRSLIHYGEESPEFAPDTETIFDLGHDDVSFIAGTGRWVGAPTGIPDDRLELLRDSFEEFIHGSEYQEWAEDAELPLNYRDPDGIDDGTEAVLGLLETHGDAIEDITA